MRVTTYESIVENGQIRFLDAVSLPERARVYVVVPGIEEVSRYYLRSPRLMHPEQAAEFAKEVIEETPDAGL
jgi:hypothetical protein